MLLFKWQIKVRNNFVMAIFDMVHVYNNVLLNRNFIYSKIYVPNLFEKLQWIGNKFNSTTIFKTNKRTLYLKLNEITVSKPQNIVKCDTTGPLFKYTLKLCIILKKSRMLVRRKQIRQKTPQSLKNISNFLFFRIFEVKHLMLALA